LREHFRFLMPLFIFIATVLVAEDVAGTQPTRRILLRTHSA